MTFSTFLLTSVFFATIATGLLAPSNKAAAQDSRSLCDTLASSRYDTTRPPGLAGVEQEKIDTAKALPACRDAQAKAPADARLAFQLGRTLMQDGKEKEALVLFEQAATAGHPTAMVNLGVALHETKPDEAFSWYSRAAALGDLLGQYNLGVAYQDGVGTPVDVTQALAWLQKSSNQGDDVAAYNIAIIHDEGTLVPENTDKALTYYRLAVDRGNTDAMVNLGIMYEKGEGVAADVATALGLYKHAAGLGDADAKAEVDRLEADDDRQE
ncbi:tetratricopeptide repeat protein [Pararhizobium antarcticum]|nr:tetratricopeptide repeat protein [Pararhizobium antarcticum]